MAKFFEMLEKRWDAGARVCIGLDSEFEKLPFAHLPLLRMGRTDEHVEDQVFEFNKKIIDATKDIALCYKLNIAFYNGNKHGQWRKAMQQALRRTIAYIRKVAPDVPVILDSKRGDIGNTNRGYVTEAFEHFDADALTVNPYFGGESLEPFLVQQDKGIIVLCKTSNPGAGEFQDLNVDAGNLQMGRTFAPLYQVVASRVAHQWNKNNNCALVVGATYPEELAEVRKIIGDNMWLLLPGAGKQAADVGKAVHNGVNSKGSGIIINSSSGIIFASSEADYAEAAMRETEKLTDQINAALEQVAA